jgi:hypothetical protein
VKSVGELQTMLAWAEDRALLRSTPSADPGAKTGARAEHTSALRSLSDRSTTAPGLAPMRQTFVARCRDIQATMPFTIQLSQSDETPFHGEPRQFFASDEVPSGSCFIERLPFSLDQFFWRAGQAHPTRD